MKAMRLHGVIRGKKLTTTKPDTSHPCPDDKVYRVIVAEMANQLWVSDFADVSILSGGGIFRLHHRCLCQEDHRLAGLPLDDHGLPTGCSEPSGQSTGPIGSGKSDPPFRQGQSVPVEQKSPIGSPRPILKHPSAASAIHTTTPWLRASSFRSRPRSLSS